MIDQEKVKKLQKSFTNLISRFSTKVSKDETTQSKLLVEENDSYLKQVFAHPIEEFMLKEKYAHYF